MITLSIYVNISVVSVNAILLLVCDDELKQLLLHGAIVDGGLLFCHSARFTRLISLHEADIASLARSFVHNL